MKINEQETQIRCKLKLKGKKLIESSECKRIEWLRESYLIELCRSKDGWFILYKDPKDKRYWELRFDFPEMQGGGPPSLININENEARNKYCF